MHKNKKALLKGWMLAAVLPLAACASSMDPIADIPDTASFHAPAEQVLGQGANVRVVVFGSDALSGSYHIGRDGVLKLGELGGIRAAGLMARELEQKIAALLAERGQRDARVSVMVD